MKKIKLSKICGFLVLCIASMFLFYACELFNFKLDTPDISINSTYKIVTWGSVKNASCYKLFCNDEEIFVQDSELSNASFNYDFSDLIEEDTQLLFQVQAIGNGIYINSDKSICVEYNVSYVSEGYEDCVQVYDDVKSPVNFGEVSTIQDKLTWDIIEDIEQYVIIVYTSDFGFAYFETNENTFLLSGIENIDQVMAIKVAAKYPLDSILYVTDNVYYYNPLNHDEYTDTIYIFDGQLRDYYITTLEELNNIIYYNFIYRTESYSFKVSKYLVNLAKTKYFLSSSDINVLEFATEKALNSFKETMYYSYSTSVVKLVDNNFKISIENDFFGIDECNTTLIPESICSQTKDEIPYYEKVEGSLISDYEFVSDNGFLSTECRTSEQLYWAVENGITPTFPNTTCRAYLLYNQAKNVLNSIIKTDMTEYEIALSIFDWIEFNTVYDYTKYTEGETGSGVTMYYGKNPGTRQQIAGYTEVSAYYLEGVFTTGVSVCDGFSKAYSLMCNMMGIECIRIVGNINSANSGSLHAWNKVKISDSFYVTDITWTTYVQTLSSLENYTADDLEHLSHNYFLISDKNIQSTHFAWSDREKFHLPKYSATSNFGYYDLSLGEYKELNQTTGVQINKVIDSTQDLIDTFKFIFNTQIYDIELIFDLNYLNEQRIIYYNSLSPIEQSGMTSYELTSATMINLLRTNKIKTQYLSFLGGNKIIAYSSLSRYTLFGEGPGWKYDLDISGKNYNTTEGYGCFYLFNILNLIDDTTKVDGEDDIVSIVKQLCNTEESFKYNRYSLLIDESLLENYLDRESYAEMISDWASDLLEWYDNESVGGVSMGNFIIEFDQGKNNGEAYIYELGNEEFNSYFVTFYLNEE